MTSWMVLPEGSIEFETSATVVYDILHSSRTHRVL